MDDPLRLESHLLDPVHEVDLVVLVVQVHGPILAVGVDDFGQRGAGEDHRKVLQRVLRQPEADDDQVALKVKKCM